MWLLGVAYEQLFEFFVVFWLASHRGFNRVQFMLSLIFLVELVAAHSQFYDIPAYYGHFSHDYFQADAFSKGKLALLEYHFAADATYDGQTLYFAHQSEHCIYSYSNSTKKVEQFAGNCGTAGNVVGSVLNVEFQNPSSLAYFRTPSLALQAKLKNQQLVITANSKCQIGENGCQLSSPYPKLKIENFRLAPPVDLYELEPDQPQFLYVADTGNHCIKRIDIAAMEVEVVAGSCGSKGFLDGPLGYNRLSSPRNLGISRNGTLYFFDAGNEYMRILTPEGSVSTLLLGACKLVGIARTIFGYELKKILCYENWIQYDTKSSVDHYFDPQNLNICTLHASQCS